MGRKEVAVPQRTIGVVRRAKNGEPLLPKVGQHRGGGSPELL